MSEQKHGIHMSPEEARAQETKIYFKLIERYKAFAWGSPQRKALSDETSSFLVKSNPQEPGDLIRLHLHRERVQQRTDEDLDYFKETLFLDEVTGQLKYLMQIQGYEDDEIVNDLFETYSHIEGELMDFTHDSVDNILN
jgi:hypothetical protein